MYFSSGRISGYYLKYIFNVKSNTVVSIFIKLTPLVKYKVSILYNALIKITTTNQSISTKKTLGILFAHKIELKFIFSGHTI